MSTDDPRPLDLRALLLRPITRRDALGVIGATAATAFLAACGSSATATPGAASAPAASGASPAASAGSSVAATAVSSPGGAAGGNVIVTHEQTLLGDLDPRTGSDNIAFFVKAQCFQTLLELDVVSGTIAPRLAAELPTQVDDVTWEMKLKPGIICHDGSTLTANDVKYTLDKINDPEFNSVYANTYNFIESVEAVDDATVRFKLKRPFGSFLDRMAVLAPVPAAAAEALGPEKFKHEPVGTGPWVLTEFVPEQSVTIVPFDQWTGDPVKLDQVMWKRYADGSARIAALQTGETDVTLVVPPDIFPVLNTGGVVTGTVAGSAYDGIIYNCGKPPFDNKLVRQAVAHAINRDEIIQAAWGGRATAAWGPLPPWHWASNPDGKKLEYDPEKSKALLTEAGLTMPVEFELLSQNNGPQLLIGTTLQAQLEKAGFAPTLKLGDGDSVWAFVEDKSWQALNFWGDTGLLGMDPDIWYRWLNYPGFFSTLPEDKQNVITKMIDDAAAIGADKPDERLSAYHALQDYLVEEGAYTHVDSRSVFDAWRENIQGFEPTYNNTPYFASVSKG